MAPIKGKRQRTTGATIDVTSALGAGTSKIKKKIRDIQRLIDKKRDVLPADILLANERAIESLKVELGNAQSSLNVKKISKKYHMVRFFEKKKALRRHKNAKKEHDELIANEAEKKEIKKARKKLNHAEVDLAYVVNFPKDRKYVALFANNEGAGASDKKATGKTEELRNSLKREIEQMMRDGTLPISVEDILAGKAGEKGTLAENFETTKDEEIVVEESDDEDDFFE